MNKEEAYQACHEIMLLAPDYVASEADGVTYLLLQITDKKEEIGIAGFLVNPAIKEQGNVLEFISMPRDQQLAVLTLSKVSGVVKELHQKIEQLAKKGAEDPDQALKTLLKVAKLMEGLENA